MTQTETETETEKYTLKNSGDRDLRFTGWLIGAASSNEDCGRWTELEIYETVGGKYIAHEVGRSRWTGEHDIYTTTVCADHAAVIEALGTGWLAMKCYRDAGIECVTEVA